MKKLLFLMVITFAPTISRAQTHLSAHKLGFSSQENLEVIPLSSDERCSSFGIKVKQNVRSHYHKWHTETLHVIKGKASMQLGDSLIELKAGDFIVIPPRTIHAVEVSSKEPLEVISIQAPEFKGKDRHFITE